VRKCRIFKTNLQASLLSISICLQMKKYCIVPLLFVLQLAVAQTPNYDSTRPGFLVFHPIRTDAAGTIIPWYSQNAGDAYDAAIKAVWNFWDTMRRDMNGLPYYMNHQVWRPLNDPRGVGGDQFAMALSSWQLLYQYTGNERVKENMKFIADYYLAHSLSPATAAWPHLPYPYNTLMYSGTYDGDMVIGKDFTQPDKAGSFGWELLKLYKITHNEAYLHHATQIANTLAQKIRPGDADNSPLPFKVNALTGAVGLLKSNTGSGHAAGKSSYTTNFSGTLELWLALAEMKKGNTADYKKATALMLDWMKRHPLKNNKWGPFFEDIPGWSDTQINAVTFAQFMMRYPQLFPDWKKQVRGILDWVYGKLGNKSWESYGVMVVNEQTAYQTPGNSHTSRQASAELQYAVLSGDTANLTLAVRQLHWATYMVAPDGKNCYPRDEVWLTDGYGDYVRHYLRAMAVMPQLAPASNHILHSTSIVSQADYAPDLNKRLVPDVKKEDLEKVVLYYRTYDNASEETIRLAAKPAQVTVNDRYLNEGTGSEGWRWQPLDNGGVLYLKHKSGNAVKIYTRL
jgi:hypothetical protein